MKSGVRFRRLETVGREQRRLIQIDRRISGVTARVDIDDLHILADRPRLDVVLPRNFDRNAAHTRQIITGSKRRIERENTQTAHGGTRIVLGCHGSPFRYRRSEFEL